MMPSDNSTTVYDYLYDRKTMEWKLWTSQIGKVEFPPDLPVRAMVVPTVDTVRYTYLLDLAIQNVQPCLFVGPTGTGKKI